MSIWSKEVVRVNGDLKVYVGIQNEYTGTIIYQMRNIIDDNGEFYFRADGQRHYVTKERQDLLNKEETIEEALKWYKATKF